MELYKKHRPKSFDRVVGNAETVAALRNMIERGTLPHTLLFHGPSGCGKTTLARIVKDAIGCHDLDYREVNSSSFRGIDTIRDIQRSLGLAPTAGKVRVWLLDECHKMSSDAQNGALKMLEDTPPHVYFFLCTTDPQKLIKAIQTRCCEMPVRLLAYDELTALVGRVLKREEVELEPKVLDELVASAQGSARTALVLLGKVLNLKPEERLAAIQNKLAEENEAIELCRALIKRVPWKRVAAVLQNLKGDPEEVRRAVLGYARTVLLKEGNHQAYMVIDCFAKPFYDTGAAGLAAAAFEAITAQE